MFIEFLDEEVFTFFPLTPPLTCSCCTNNFIYRECGAIVMAKRFACNKEYGFKSSHVMILGSQQIDPNALKLVEYGLIMYIKQN